MEKSAKIDDFGLPDTSQNASKIKGPKKLRFFDIFWGYPFWIDFGRVWGGFWEAKIIDFRTFFDVFSKQISTADQTRKMVPRIAPKGGGTEIELPSAMRARATERGRGEVYTHVYEDRCSVYTP